MSYTEFKKLQFPVGDYIPNQNPSLEVFNSYVMDIEKFPSDVERLIKDIYIEQLNWKYRPNGWTVKQVIHHCADSHMNGFIRLKLSLTEDTPTIKPYLEAKWAELPDSETDSIEHSMNILKGIHKKWAILIKSLVKEQWHLAYYHPEYQTKVSLVEYIGLYAWHCQHHLAHIKIGMESKGIYN